MSGRAVGADLVGTLVAVVRRGVDVVLRGHDAARAVAHLLHAVAGRLRKDLRVVRGIGDAALLVHARTGLALVVGALAVERRVAPDAHAKSVANERIAARAGAAAGARRHRRVGGGAVGADVEGADVVVVVRLVRVVGDADHEAHVAALDLAVRRDLLGDGQIDVVLDDVLALVRVALGREAVARGRADRDALLVGVALDTLARAVADGGGLAAGCRVHAGRVGQRGRRRRLALHAVRAAAVRGVRPGDGHAVELVEDALADGVIAVGERAVVVGFGTAHLHAVLVLVTARDDALLVGVALAEAAAHVARRAGVGFVGGARVRADVLRTLVAVVDVVRELDLGLLAALAAVRLAVAGDAVGEEAVRVGGVNANPVLCALVDGADDVVVAVRVDGANGIGLAEARRVQAAPVGAEPEDEEEPDEAQESDAARLHFSTPEASQTSMSLEDRPKGPDFGEEVVSLRGRARRSARGGAASVRPPGADRSARDDSETRGGARRGPRRRLPRPQSCLLRAALRGVRRGRRGPQGRLPRPQSGLLQAWGAAASAIAVR